MDKYLVNFFKKHHLKLLNKTLVVAVSTGIDSMCLLTALLTLKSEYNLNLHIAHFNHLKREQSQIEEAFIKEFALEKNILCHIGYLHEENNRNFQNYAREQRYQFFENLVRKVKADYLLLAHHANDDMETILMRMIRGSNLKGYAGMEEVSLFRGIPLLRPFLRITKDELIDYANLHRIKYYQDSSNFEDIYTRNRIRKEIVPAFFNEDEKVHLKFQEFSETLLAVNELLEAEIKKFRKHVLFEKNCFGFVINDFQNLSAFLQQENLFSLLKEYNLGKANILEIIKLINSRKKNIKYFYKGLFTFVKEYDWVYFYDGNIETPQVDLLIKAPGVYHLSDKIKVNVIKKEYVNISKNEDLWYNSNMLPFRVRSRKAGDKILLAAGYKKVKDLLIDKKIGILDRERILILEKDKEILAVIGIAKSKILKEIKENDILVKVEQNYG